MKVEHARARFEQMPNYEIAWPDPDMTLIEEARRAPPDLPVEALGLLAEPVLALAEVKSAPPDYVFAGLLAAASAAVGNKRFAAPWDGWSEPPVLFVGIVGDPSSGKSPALDVVLDPLRQIESERAVDLEPELRRHAAAVEAAKHREQAWEAEVKTAVDNGFVPPSKPADAEAPEPPARYRAVLNDVTVEELVNVAARQFSSLLFVRDELAGWLANLEKYGRGDRAFWLEANGGRRYVVDRVKYDAPKIVDHLAVGLVGGIQPDRLVSLFLKSDDDGLLARFLVVWPRPVPPERPKRAALTAQTAIERALRRLHALAADEVDGRLQPRPMPFTDDAAEMLQEFRRGIHKRIAEADGLMKSHLGKYPGLLIRIATTLAYLEAGLAEQFAEPVQIGLRHAGFAAHLLEIYFLPMAERVYGDAANPKSLRSAARLAKLIYGERLDRIAPREVQTRKLSGLKTAEDVRQALGVLEDHGWVMRADDASPASGPRAERWAVNPAVHAGGRQ